ncbi:hypothetical protein IWW36_004136 [Coemansia brasiliensis]|uniref:Chitin-binding type-4 domain-containing protein n=1 Tax=Coemansia brasiliensis TaxID=2650707 RepID=A0A9W8ICR2_9FUNG|nr:hypothetical protein IWW36_004136 [Coemansia brasiliensis]
MLFKIGSIAALLGAVNAHMALTKPCPRHSPNCDVKPPLPAGVSDYDYNEIKSPIPYDGVLCKSNIPWTAPVETWTAGQDVTYKFQTDGAAHGGGHCQFSLSYDGGKTFVVIHEELRYCFFNGPSDSNTAQVTEYTFKLPAEVPNSDNVIAAWSWVNAIGNREFYHNCADIKIQGSSSSSYTGKQMVIANHDGYPTIREFNGNYDTGLEHYTNAKQITVTGSGSTDPAPPASSESSEQPQYTSSAAVAPPVGHTPNPSPSDAASATAEPAPATTVPVPATSEPAPVTDEPAPATSSAPAPVPTGTDCTHGALKCNDGNTGFHQCVWGKWSSVIGCPSKTACKQTSANAIICDWA